MPTRPETEAMLTIAPDGIVLLVGAAKKQWQECASDQVDAAYVDVEQAVEVFGLGGFNGANVADAGIVDEDVEAVERGPTRQRSSRGW